MSLGRVQTRNDAVAQVALDTGDLGSGQQEQGAGGQEPYDHGSNVETPATREKMAGDKSRGTR